MHRIFFILIVAALPLLLTACGNSSTSATTDTAKIIDAKDSVRLSWTPPNTRSDGSYLQVSDLAGYRVYMGTSTHSLSAVVDLNDDSITQYTIDNLPAGSYYFAVTAYDVDGLESGYSQIIQVNLS